MLSSPLLGVLFGLVAAISFGSGDFCGGIATRRSGQYPVVALASLAGMVTLVVLWRLSGEVFPSAASLVWVVMAGGIGTLGLIILYKALALGCAASTAPTAAVIGAGMPVLVNAFLKGMPSPFQLAGFFLAIPGIWLVSRGDGSTRHDAKTGVFMGILAGITFGIFFIFIGQVAPGEVFGPLVVSRAIASIITVSLLLIKRENVLPALRNPVAWLAGILDVGGNIFYLLAKHNIRLDVAAVLASLSPAVTVVMARSLVKDRVTRSQWVGVVMCLGAIVLIAWNFA